MQQSVAAQTVGAKEASAILCSLAAGEDSTWGTAGDSRTPQSGRAQLATHIRGLLIILLGALATSEEGLMLTPDVDYELGVRLANDLLRVMARDGRLAVRTSYFRVRGSR